MEIREERMADHMMKYHVEGLPTQATIHHFTGPDFGDYHDHPYSFTSFIISGGYCEEVLNLTTGNSHKDFHYADESFLIEADHAHRIIEVYGSECWTMILPQAWVKTPGFLRVIDGVVCRRDWDCPDFTPIK